METLCQKPWSWRPVRVQLLPLDWETVLVSESPEPWAWVHSNGRFLPLWGQHSSREDRVKQEEPVRPKVAYADGWEGLPEQLKLEGPGARVGG